MSNPSITAIMVVKNEQNWVWYAIHSVLDYVDEMLICDTGSKDATLQVVSQIKDPKIKFSTRRPTDKAGMAAYRQQLIESASGDWLFTVDGDEVWPDDSISLTRDTILRQNANLEYIISPYYNCLGDIFHYQEEMAGRYRIHQYQGHITFRACNRRLIPGLHMGMDDYLEGLYDGDGRLVQDREPFKGLYLPAPYLHLTHLDRSPQGQNSLKKKYELGFAFPKNFKYPKSFFQPRPPAVPSPWTKRGVSYLIPALIQTPLKMARRRLSYAYRLS